MSLKEELLEKVSPQSKERPQFQALLDHIKKNKIENKEHLVKSLNQEIALTEKWLKDNKNTGATAVKSVRNQAIKLDVLKKCQKVMQEFLLLY